MKRLLISLLTIGVIGGSALGLSGAFFSDTETSIGNVLSAGAIDLQIDNTSYYNNATSSATTWTLTDLTIEKFFNFSDVKPGDVGEDTISVHVNTNDAWLCADVTLTSDDENGIQPVESIDGDVTDGTGSGELADRINFLWWADDGDNVLEDNETVLPGGPIGALAVGESATVRLADSTGSIWGSGPLPGATTKYIGKAWCFGTLTPAPLPQKDGLTPANSTGGVSCDGSGEGNQTQTDSLTADITFNAVQSRNNPDFECAPPPPLACEDQWASSVASSNQLLRKNGTAVLPDRSDPTDALVAQSTGTPSDSPVIAGSFFSLGFGGSIVVGFSQPFLNGPGNDLSIYEVTGGTYPDELADVEVSSAPGGPWTLIGNDVVRDESLEMINPTAQYVRITDQSPLGPFEATADGFDLDGVQALCGQPE